MPEAVQTKEPEPVVIRREPETVLVSWQAPARPFKRRSKKFYVTLLGIASVASLILFIAEWAMPVILLAALLFLFFILNTVPPEVVEYQITTQGIKIAQKKTSWNLLGRFWLTEKPGQILLTLETAGFPGRLEFLIPLEKKDEIKKALSSYLPEEKISPSVLEKAATWVSEKLPEN